jgi:hypothetical protein
MHSRLWFACEHPERENDAWILWHSHNCRGCALKAEATKRIYFDDLTLNDLSILDYLIEQNVS